MMIRYTYKSLVYMKLMNTILYDGDPKQTRRELQTVIMISVRNTYVKGKRS